MIDFNKNQVMTFKRTSTYCAIKKGRPKPKLTKENKLFLKSLGLRT